jgi:hypothetical protein
VIRDVDCFCSSYLIRAELIALHEADVSYTSNPRRGAQFYPDCVQIEVTGNGTVELPKGVGFPGAYAYEDPGVVHNVRFSSPVTLFHLCDILILMAMMMLILMLGLLLHLNPETLTLYRHYHAHSMRHRLHHPWSDRLVWRMAHDNACRTGAGERSDDACAVEYVDCEQRGDERDV